MVYKIRPTKQCRPTACQMDGHTAEIDILQIFDVKYEMIYNSVGYDSIDMKYILVDNEVDITHIYSMLYNQNSEGHIYIYIYIYIFVCVYACIYIYIYIYIYN